MKGHRSFIVSLFTMALIALLCITAFAANNALPFTDVTSDQWYYNEVKRGYESGIINGISETIFNPDGVLNREMFVTMLLRSSGINVQLYQDSDTGFADVPAGRWYSPYIECAKKIGVAEGEGNGKFGLGKPVTREQMAVLAARFSAASGGVSLKQSSNPVPSFSDMDSISKWAVEAVEAMRLSGVFQGDENQRFHPQRASTRAEGVAVIMRLQDAMEDGRRPSIVPENTCLIRLADASGGEPIFYDIQNPKDVNNMIEYINSVQIRSEKALPDHGGWTYRIAFYDKDKHYLAGYIFDTNWIEVDSVRLYTDDNFFSPLLDLTQY